MTLGTTPQGIALQERDLDLLRGLYESRLMTLAHVATLYFDGKPEAAKKRVQRLKAAGFVGQRPRRAYEPSVLFLARAGFDLLQARGSIAAFPSATWATFEKRSRVKDSTLRHELDVMDVKAAMVAAIQVTSQFKIVEYSTWPRLYEFSASQPHGERVTMKPDGFIRITDVISRGNLERHRRI